MGFEFKPVNERLDIEQKFVFQGFLNQITRHISHFEGPQARFGVLGYWRAKKDFNALGSLKRIIYWGLCVTTSSRLNSF